MIEKYVTDLDELSEKEYADLKAAERAEAEEWLAQIRMMKDSTIINRDNRVVVDLKSMFEDSVRMYGNNILYKQIMKGDNDYSCITFNEAMQHIQGLGTKLIDMGFKHKHIGIIGSNCYEWAESYNAIIGGVGIVVPLDKDLDEEDLANLCREGNIKLIIACSGKHYKKVKAVKDGGDTPLEMIITTELDEHDAFNSLYSWTKIRAEGMDLVKNGDRRWIDARIKNDDMAIILFTSGTTGVAKGVMLSHRNITSSLMWVNLYIRSDEHDTYFSILPMHHVYESSCTMIQTMFKGASVAYNRGLKYIMKDIQLAQPTVMLAVPLIYEKFYNNIQKGLIKEGKDKRLDFIMKLNKVTMKIDLNISRKAASKIVEQFGNNIRIFIAGGAKSDPKILQFFRDLGILAVQGYGLTETSPLIALNPVDNKYIKNDSAGRLILGTEMMIIDPDENGCGELCFKGPQVMLGYYNNDEATEACMRNGWFHSGDIGYVGENNYLYITGRKKTVIIAGNGKNVYPDELEKKLQRSPFIEECMVWADESGEETGHRGIYATIRVDEEAIKAELGDRAGNDEAVYMIIDREVDKINANMPDWKSVKHIRIRKREFNKTTAMKIKRFVDDNKLGS